MPEGIKSGNQRAILVNIRSKTAREVEFKAEAGGHAN
jgi:hypothetical protein